MAYVNLQTKKIYGCKEGTKTYYHEQGHLIFEEIKNGAKIRALQDLSIRALLFSVALGVLYSSLIIKVIILSIILLSIYLEMYEELWCWKFAFKKTKEVKESDSKKEIPEQV